MVFRSMEQWTTCVDRFRLYSQLRGAVYRKSYGLYQEGLNAATRWRHVPYPRSHTKLSWSGVVCCDGGTDIACSFEARGAERRSLDESYQKLRLTSEGQPETMRSESRENLEAVVRVVGNHKTSVSHHDRLEDLVAEMWVWHPSRPTITNCVRSVSIVVVKLPKEDV